MKWILEEGTAARDTIEEYGKIIGVDLPEDYINLVQEHDGSTPIPKCFDMQHRKEAVFSSLLSFSTTDESTILEKYNDMKSISPSKLLLPFANDPFGNLLCFDYRDTKHNPKIVFWDHEADVDSGQDPISSVENSFSEFIDKLYDPDEE